ncbi:MAG: hypothetical protein COU85_01945 [Candidatus Portnoybacteria bacterium CG10_big_fil_rev_8_21_14_0_10_44_7]|uniref:Uncharacterized protein n=1 Tax=Candidatus Portnoybacteria bacterium CG10_big_fil_rev_8_21_14_0_10_44_7 TaxID=1974816 RepID=A0A2M8KIL5_9BACT|nr:MAG: hypothetical protein COU85_01945 [Candidatus Portnoybacteria bacterium CG10_big_fil_rev_8_21_14_0_10_44_7]
MIIEKNRLPFVVRRQPNQPGGVVFPPRAAYPFPAGFSGRVITLPRPEGKKREAVEKNKK